MEVALIKNLLAEHQSFYLKQQSELRRYKACYEMKFWQQSNYETDDAGGQIQIQTPEAYGYIESFQASLFSKNPNVVVKYGARGSGNPEKAQGLANNWLVNRARKEVENWSRLALIYPMSFIKLVPTDSVDVYDRIIPVPIPPWEIILDRDAPRWELQRYVGHIYFMPLHEAKTKFGNKKFTPQNKEDYMSASEEDVPEEMRFIKVVEMYDLVNNKMTWWSPDWLGGEKLLDSAEIIPFISPQGNPVIPIIPLYYNCIPDRPLDGYSAMRRIYDQLYEQNVIRSFQANAVRKAARQWLVKKGTFDEEDMNKITSGIDGLFIEVEAEDLERVILPVPNSPVPPELSRYYLEVTSDKDKGAVMAPFTRGESTKATATEIAALAAYTSSEVGRLARERDAAIENLARTYLCMLSTFIAGSKTERVVIDGKLEIVKAEDLLGDFLIYASDSSSTPISELVAKQEFISNIGNLQTLGVPNNLILKELVRRLDLPESFIGAEQSGKLPIERGQAVDEMRSKEEVIQQPSAAGVEAILGAM